MAIELHDDNGNTYILEDSYYGMSGGETPKGFWKTLSINIVFIVWCLIFVLLPLIFFLLIAPSYQQFVDALVESGALVVLWVFSIVNIAINIKRKVFLHKLRNSQEDKFVQLRQELDNLLNTEDGQQTTQGGVSPLYYDRYDNQPQSGCQSTADGQSGNSTEKTDEYQEKERFFIREIKHPLVKSMKSFRFSLICIFGAVILLSVLFPNTDITGYASMFLGPMFAYSYIFDIVSGYVIFGKKWNWMWLGLIVAVFVSTFLMGFEVLEKIAEYLLFICLILANQIILSRLEKSEK